MSSRLTSAIVLVVVVGVWSVASVEAAPGNGGGVGSGGTIGDVITTPLPSMTTSLAPHFRVIEVAASILWKAPMNVAGAPAVML